MGYFNYHAKVKNLIAKGHCKGFELVDDWNGIKPAMVIYFDNNKPMPIREHKWDEYFILFRKETECQE